MYYGTKNPHGGDIYESNIRLDFSANVNPFGMPASVKEAAAAALQEADRYPDPYCRELVRAIAEAEELPAEDVFVGNGASELILAYCLAQKFRRAAVAVPSFIDYTEALEKAGTEVVFYFMKKENGFVPDDGILRFLEQEKPDALFLCSPNNPTGRSVPEALLEKILARTKEENISLFMDECFYELSDGRRTIKKELADSKNLFILRAFTKCYGMAGLRLGYSLCADHELLKNMSVYTPPWSVSGPAQKAGVAALKETDYLERTVREIRTEREWLSGRLAELGLTVYPSEVNYLFFEGQTDLPQLLRNEGVLIRDCSNYEGLGPGYYRIAVRTHKENEEFIRTLGQVLGKPI